MNECKSELRECLIECKDLDFIQFLKGNLDYSDFCSRWKCEKKEKRIKLTCKNCKENYSNFGVIYLLKTQKFCSPDCSSEWMSKNNRGRFSVKYKLWRKSVFERDGFQCCICGEVGGRLNAHHIKNWKDHPELRYRVDNGMTMCQDCHDIVDIELPLFSIKSLI